MATLSLAPLNVADRLDDVAKIMPQAIAIAEPRRRVAGGRRLYRTVSFRELADDVDRIARGLVSRGMNPGMRLALLVPPSIDFITLVFALLKSGAVQILIDPGIGKRNLVRCLAEALPEGFIAVPMAQAIRSVLPRRFSKSTFNVTVGRRLWWGGLTLEDLRSNSPGRKAGVGTLNDANPALPGGAIWRSSDREAELLRMTSDDPAAIIFTSGSTGPPKGVLYRQGNFDRQVTEIRDTYGISPGEIDLPCFPLFGLFNAAMGVTTVLPRMNFSRPATVNPRNIVEAIEQWQVTQSFASPAVWNRVGPYCEQRGLRLQSLRRVMSAGAPVPARVLRLMRAVIHPDGEVHTPYGATEALPVATIGSSEVLTETWSLTEQGGGVCVGRRFRGIEWRVIRIIDGPIHSIDQAEELPVGEIGELIVRGPVVTTEYVTRRAANALAKIEDRQTSALPLPKTLPEGAGASFWHRMGDCGYFDDQERFWFCGRVTHRVLTKAGPMYTIPCEAIFNRHAAVFRSALVGVGATGAQTPVIVVERNRDMPTGRGLDRDGLIKELRKLAQANPLTTAIEDFLIHPSMPVDVRHNAKIFREKLAIWAASRIHRRINVTRLSKDIA
ncbi:MAG: fatty acid CoA ligase family protein [Pirellulales bacterium]